MLKTFKKYHLHYLLRRIKKMLKRRRSFYLYLCIIALILYGLLKVLGSFILPIEINITHRDMLEQHKCPACFGENLCSDISQGRLKLTEWTRFTISRLFNARNIYYGVFRDSKHVIGKKLGHDTESEMLDGAICTLSDKSPYHCNPAHYVKFLTALYSKEKDTVIKNSINRKSTQKYVFIRTPTKHSPFKVQYYVEMLVDFDSCNSVYKKTIFFF